MNNKVKNQLLYTKDHEWIKISNNEIVIGITDFAQKQLGDIVYVDLPEKKKIFKKKEVIVVLESVKSVNDILSPLDCKISDVNSNLIDNPELINDHPYTKGWILKVNDALNIEKVNFFKYEEYLNFIKNIENI